ncbi:hypothetical protein LCGC14_2819720, partial [marine sediment metagenome]
RIHLVGIKGTGMTALAEILLARGALLGGSDGAERFYTDRILKELGIPFWESFEPEHVALDAELVIHSAAYCRESNVELLTARQRGLPVLSYPEAIGLLSVGCDASGIAGTHGKTTTTAMVGTILKVLEIPVTVLVGSEVANFGGRSTLVLGDKYFVAETCEYRRHFLNFQPERIVLTGIETEHLDYYRDLEDVLSAFEQYCRRLPPGGLLIYQADDPGNRRVVEGLKGSRPDLCFQPYGRGAEGAFQITAIKTEKRLTRFKLRGFNREFILKHPGEHSAHNAAAALALAASMLQREGEEFGPDRVEAMAKALYDFRGSRRRSEVIGEAAGVLFMDDYGHHPTEVLKTLAGIKAFYPERRLVVDFMSHTFSRTERMLYRMGDSFGGADQVIVTDIFAAREANDGR